MLTLLVIGRLVSRETPEESNTTPLGAFVQCNEQLVQHSRVDDKGRSRVGGSPFRHLGHDARVDVAEGGNGIRNDLNSTEKEMKYCLIRGYDRGVP